MRSWIKGVLELGERRTMSHLNPKLLEIPANLGLECVPIACARESESRTCEAVSQQAHDRRPPRAAPQDLLCDATVDSVFRVR